MEIDYKLLEQIKTVLEVINDESILICLNIHCTIRQHINEPSILLITDSNFYVLIQNEYKLRALCKIKWPFLKKITMSDKSSFTVFDQNGNYLIQSSDSSLIVSKLINYLKSFLFQNELPDIQVDSSFLVQTETTQIPQLQRFLYLTTKINLKPPKKLIKRYEEDLAKHQMIDFASYPSASNFSELLIDSITIGPSLTSLSVPTNPKKSNWRFVEKILKYNSKLSFISFHDRIDSSFSKLAEEITYTIEAVKFCDTQFQNEHAQILLTFLSNAKVHSLAFSNACDSSFLVKMASVGDLSQITTLSLVNFQGVDAQLIFKNFKGLKNLKILNDEDDVSNSQEDISTIINSISITNVLETIEITCGKAISNINTAMAIPKSLHSITFSQIQWEQNTFIDAWVCFSQHQPNSNLKLDFSGATPTDKIWRDFNEILPQYSKKLAKITELRFESNPIKLQFILFLKRLPSLQKLSIAGSLSQDNPPLIEQFCQFVSSTSTLKELNISGNEYGVLRTSIIPLLKEMQNNNSIEVLDVSNNNFGEPGLKALQDLLMSNKLIRSINFSGNKIDSSDALVSFFDSMEQRKFPLKFEFPIEDINFLKKKNKIRSSVVLKLKKSYDKIQSIELEDDEKQDEISFGSEQQNDSIEDLVNGSEWKLPYPDIPEPDNTIPLQQFNNTYSLIALVQKFYSSE